MSDNIHHPSYYNSGSIETIEIIKDQGWTKGFCLGNAIKYITRAGKKDPSKTIEDLKKAIQYISYYIKSLEEEDAAISEDDLG